MDELEKNWKYQNTTFYVIYCKNETITNKYIGHTTNFALRTRSHEESCVSYPHRKLYHFINSHGGWSNWIIKAIELQSCFSQYQAIEREQYLADKYNADLNEYSPCKNPTLRKYRQTWYQKHKEEQLARMRKQYQLAKEFRRLRSICI